MHLRRRRPPALRRLLATSAALLGLTAAPTTTTASTAVFLPRTSTARVDRHHVTASVGRAGTVIWNTFDLAGGAADVGLLVAVRVGGRVEISARVWIDVVEATTGVKVSSLNADVCTPLGASGTGSGTGPVVPGGAGASGSGEASGGCRGKGSASADGGASGGCFSNSSAASGGCGSGGGCGGSGGGGCGSCDGCEPSENGHPGCSAFTACAPHDDTSGSSGGLPDASMSGPSVGPYELFKVGAADGSARAWLVANDYDVGLSFDEAATAIERDGYELYAVRARAPTPSAVVHSLRVVTTSNAPTFPLRTLRMGASSNDASTPLTLVVLANTAHRPADTELLRIDESRLAWTGSTSNYESLVAATLGVPPSSVDAGPVDAGSIDAGAFDAGDAGAPPGDAGALPSATRWLVESSRSVQNRITPKTDGGEGGTSEAATLADSFRTQCGGKAKQTHTVCGPEDAGDAGEEDDDAGIDDAGADVDGGADAGADAATPDGGLPDASDEDAEAPDSSTAEADCTDVDRQRCDDIDLAIPTGGAAIATRFRAVVAGDPALVGDLSFTATTEVLPTGRYFVRADGQSGLCEPPADEAATASSDGAEDAQTCKQTRARRRTGFDLGPLVLVLVAARAVSFILRRRRR